MKDYLSGLQTPQDIFCVWCVKSLSARKRTPISFLFLYMRWKWQGGSVHFRRNSQTPANVFFATFCSPSPHHRNAGLGNHISRIHETILCTACTLNCEWSSAFDVSNQIKKKTLKIYIYFFNAHAYKVSAVVAWTTSSFALEFLNTNETKKLKFWCLF